MQQVLSIDTIVSDPAIRSGRPVIAGTGIMVSDIAVHHEVAKMTPDKIAEQLQLSIDQVYAALAYYFTHKQEIDDEVAENDRAAEELREQLTRGRD